MKWTLDKQLFAGLALIVFLFNLTLINNFAWIWGGAETYIAQQVIEKEVNHPITWLVAQFTAFDPFQLTNLRLPSTLAVLITLIVVAWMTNKILDLNFRLLLLLTLAGNFLIYGFAKTAASDAWSMLFQTLAILGTIRFMKTPSLLWRLIAYLGIGLATWIHPMSSWILFLLLPTIYYIFHDDGKRMWSLNPWSILMLITLLLYFTGQLKWIQEVAYLGWGQLPILKFFGLNLLAVLPLLGFLMAGLYSAFKRVRKKEEFSLLFLPWFGVALLAQSPSLTIVISLFIAKHVGDYLLKNYPYKNIVKVYSTIHLISFFFLASILMLGGFFVFLGQGFRSGLSFSIVYWVLSFLMVIGLFGDNRRFLFIGAFMIGILSTTLFSLQVFPLLENQRIARKLIQEMEKEEVPPKSIIYESERAKMLDNSRLYLNKQFPDAMTGAGTYDYGRNLLIKVQEKADSNSIQGWKDNLQRINYGIEEQ